MKKIFLLRHAKPAIKPGRFVGSTDVGLDEQGRAQALSIADVLQKIQPDRCFSSPLKRCIETLSPSHLKFDINPDLREIDFGNWEEKTFDEIKQAEPLAVNQWAEFAPDFSFPGGERMSDFLARIQRLGDTLSESPAKTILAVTHAGVIRALICHFLGLHPRHYLLFEIEYASLTTLHLFDDKGVLQGLNQYGRMEGA